MGGPAVPFKGTIDFKSLGASGFKAQDQQAGWTHCVPLFVTASVTSDPATVENGCSEPVRGRHREGLIGDAARPQAQPH